MKPIVYKRGLAYLIDILIISLIFIIIQIYMPKTNDYRDQIGLLNEAVIREEIGRRDYLSQLVELNYQVDLERGYETAISMLLLVFFFIIIPKINQKTIGQLLVGIKIKSDYLTLKQLFIRAVVVNGLLYTMIGLLLLFTVSSFVYFMVLSLLGIIQIIITIKSIFMILLNEDSKGLQDIWSNTEIIFEGELK